MFSKSYQFKFQIERVNFRFLCFFLQMTYFNSTDEIFVQLTWNNAPKLNINKCEVGFKSQHVEYIRKTYTTDVGFDCLFHEFHFFIYYGVHIVYCMTAIVALILVSISTVPKTNGITTNFSWINCIALLLPLCREKEEKID